MDDKVYVNVPMRKALANKLKRLAKKSRRAAGRQVEWIVERFFSENN